MKIGEQCSCFTKQKHKEYVSDDFYKSSQWAKVKKECIQMCCGLDLYSFYVNNIIEYGFTVHHIIPIDVKPELKLIQSNLIYLTESNHRMIHSLYDSGEYEQTVLLLQNLKEKFVGGI